MYVKVVCASKFNDEILLTFECQVSKSISDRIDTYSAIAKSSPDSQATRAGWRHKFWDIYGHISVFCLFIQRKLRMPERMHICISDTDKLIKIILSANDFTFLALSDPHPGYDTNIEYKKFVKCIKHAVLNTEYNVLREGEWHLPYIYSIDKGQNPEFLIKISAVRCAAILARTVYLGEARSEINAFNTLINSDPNYLLSLQHQAKTPIPGASWQALIGVTHISRKKPPWSAQFRGFIMFRKIYEEAGQDWFIYI